MYSRGDKALIAFMLCAIFYMLFAMRVHASEQLTYDLEHIVHALERANQIAERGCK